MSRTVRIISVLIAAFSLSFYFVNCAGGLPDVNSTMNKSSSAFSVSISPNQVLAGGTAQILVMNGSAPFTYKVTSGTAAIDTNGGISGTALGDVVIQIDDSTGHQAFATLSVVSQTTGAAAKSCTTPWGAVVPDGGTASGFTSSQVECPATCSSATVSCTNGVLSGAAKSASCSVASCVYKQKALNFDCSTKGTTFLNAVPASCAASNYHGFICVANLGFFEYLCVSPSETVP